MISVARPKSGVRRRFGPLRAGLLALGGPAASLQPPGNQRDREEGMSFGRWIVAIPASLVLLLAACSKSGPQAVSPPPPHAAASPSAAAHEGVAVTIRQWSIKPSSTTMAAGAVTFSVSNAGTIPH